MVNGRAAAITVVLAVLLVACSNGVEEPSWTNVAPDGTTTTAQPTPERKLALTLAYHAEPGDNSGIMRDTDDEGTPCGTSGFTERSDTFSFMKSGTEALLLDGAGTILAKSTLDAPGTAHNIGRAGKNEVDCLWELSFTKVPEVDFYQVEIGGVSVATMTAEDVEESGWDLAVEMQPRAR